jgi:CheY-like chemotaxis protein
MTAIDCPQNPVVVLVVEDETLLRMNAVCMVEDTGYIAIEAADAKAAVEVLESRSDVALLLTDVQMPGPIGRDRACSCRAGTVAADQDHRGFRRREAGRRRHSRRLPVLRKTAVGGGSGRGNARPARARLRPRTVALSAD